MESSIETVATDQEQATAKIAMFAGRIKDNDQLRAIVRSAQLGLQRGVYNQIVPYLSFKPQSFRKLIRHAR